MSQILFIVDDQGKRTAVILEIEAYNTLLAELEALRLKTGHADTPAVAHTEEEKAIVEDRLKALGYL